MLYNVLTCKDSWLYVKYFKLDKQKQMLNELEKRIKNEDMSDILIKTYTFFQYYNIFKLSFYI